jgi:hypothetical protein
LCVTAVPENQQTDTSVSRRRVLDAVEIPVPSARPTTTVGFNTVDSAPAWPSSYREKRMDVLHSELNRMEKKWPDSRYLLQWSRQRNNVPWPVSCVKQPVLATEVAALNRWLQSHPISDETTAASSRIWRQRIAEYVDNAKEKDSTLLGWIAEYLDSPESGSLPWPGDRRLAPSNKGERGWIARCMLKHLDPAKDQ